MIRELVWEGSLFLYTVKLSFGFVSRVHISGKDEQGRTTHILIQYLFRTIASVCV